MLGWQRWREIEEENALGTLKVGDAGSPRLEGRIPRELVDLFAHTLLATMNELAFMIVRSDDIEAAQRTGRGRGRRVARPPAGTTLARPLKAVHDGAAGGPEDGRA